MHIPLFSLHTYRSVYENNRLFREPPLLGPPLSCANTITIISIATIVNTIIMIINIIIASILKQTSLRRTIKVGRYTFGAPNQGCRAAYAAESRGNGPHELAVSQTPVRYGRNVYTGTIQTHPSPTTPCLINLVLGFIKCRHLLNTHKTELVHCNLDLFN